MFYFWRLGCLRPQSSGRLLFYCLCWMSDKHFPPPAASVAPPETTAGGVAASSAPHPLTLHLFRHQCAQSSAGRPHPFSPVPSSHSPVLPIEPLGEPGHPYLLGTQPRRVSLWKKPVWKSGPGGEKGRQSSKGATKTAATQLWGYIPLGRWSCVFGT